MIARAKVLKSPYGATVDALAPTDASPRRARVVRKTIVEASARAAAIVAEASERAAHIVAAAERAAADLRGAAVEEGRARGYAEVLSRVEVVARLEADVDARSAGRNVEMARLLAERLIGAAVGLEPLTVAGLASQVLAEVRGARQLQLHVSPDDVATLSRALGATPGLVVVPDAGCGRGDFRVVTEVGSIEAKLGDRLDLLAAKLAEALHNGA